MHTFHGDIKVKKNLVYAHGGIINYDNHLFSLDSHQDTYAKIGPEGISTIGIFADTGNFDCLDVGNTAVINNLSISGTLNASMLTFDNLTITGKLTGNQLCVTADAIILDDLIVGNNFTVDTDTFYVDAITDRVGINTTAPAYELDVSGTINYSGSLLKNGVPVNADAWADGIVGIYNTDLNNVGIGTSNPSYDLDVSGNINLSGTLFQNGTTFESGWATEGNDLYNLNSGNVGIGTTTPSTLLEVSGASLLNSLGVSTNTTLTGDLDVSGDTILNTLTTSGASQLSSLGVSLNSTLIGDLDVSGDTTLNTLTTTGASQLNSLGVSNNTIFNGDLSVLGDTTLNTFTTTGAVQVESLSITNDLSINNGVLFVDASLGRVGINTTAPAYDLDVSGHINTNQPYRISGIQVLSSISLGSNIVNSSLTNLGILTGVTVSGDSRLNGFVDIPNNLGVSSIGVTSHIDFTFNGSPSHNEGRVFYDSGEHALAVYNDESEVTHQLGQEGFIRVYNNSGSLISNGQVVYISGTELVENRPTIGLALADSETTARVIGIATHDIEDDTFGYVTFWGLVNDLDTSSFSAGDTLHLSITTPGGLTTSPASAGNFEVQVGFCISVGTTTGRVLTILNEDLSEKVNSKTFSTGVLSGGVLSIGVTSEVFTITDGTGLITDSSTGDVTNVSWSGLTNQSAAYSGILTYISIGTTGNIITNTSRPSNSDLRDQIFLGVLVHVNAVDIDAVNNEQLTILHPTNQLVDLMGALGFLNITGNEISSNSLLTIAKSTGEMFADGSNYANDIDNPHVITLAAIDTNSGGQFQYRYQDGSGGPLTDVNIIPGEYDDGNGQSSPGAVSSTQYTIQRLYSFTSNNLKIQPGQFLYNSLAEAKGAIQTETFVTEPSIKGNGLLIGFLIVSGGATDLSVASDAIFIQANKFGNITGAGGTSVSRLQDAYDNSELEPEILTNSSSGAITIRRGSAADTDNVFVVQNNAETNTFVVKGTGAVVGAGAALFNSLGISGNTVITGDIDVLGDGDVAGKLFAGSFCVTGDSTFIGDVNINGGLNVLGAITSSESVSVATSSPLLELGIGNPADILDTGWYTHYNDGTTRFAGLIRDVSDSSQFKIFAGVTLAPDPNFTFKVDDSELANFKVNNLLANSNLQINNNATIVGNLGVTGNVNSGGVFMIEDVNVLSANTLGSGVVNASLTTNIGNLGITGNVNLATTSHEYFIDNVRVLNYDTLGVGVTFSSLERLGTLNTLTVGGLATFNDFVAMNDNVGMDSLGVTFNAIIGGNLVTVGNIGTTGVYQIDGTEVLGPNTLGVGVTSSSLETVGTLLSLSVTGDINTTGGVYQIDGMDVFDDKNTLGTGVTSSNLGEFSTNINRQFSTGLVSGGLLSLGSTEAVFNISSGQGDIIGVTTGILTGVSWADLNDVLVTVAGDLTFISLDSTGSVVSSTSFPTSQERRENIFLGILTHLTGVTLDTAVIQPEVLLNQNNQLYDFMEALGIFNISGNVVDSTSGLTINKSTGNIFSWGRNYENNISNPHNVSLGAFDTSGSDVFRYIYQDESRTDLDQTVIIPGEYDDGNGQSTPGTVASNRFTIQRVYTFSTGTISVQPGQFLYKSIAEALAAIPSEAFVTSPLISEFGLLLAFLIVKGNATDLSDTDEAEFVIASRFGTTTGAGGTSVSTIQQTYDNTAEEPELLTNTTRGALSIRRGSAADTDNVLEIQEGVSGFNRFTVTGDGDTTMIGDFLVGTTLFYVNSSTNFVGIGTTAPAFELDVSGDINFEGDLRQNGNLVSFGSQWTVEGTDIYANNIGTGNVGIGTTTPAYELDVSGDINGVVIRIEGVDIETVFNIIQVENQKTNFNSFLLLDSSNDMAQDFSGGVTEFIYTNASSTETLFVSNIVISIKDDGVFNMSDFASTSSSLTNGINIYSTTDSGATRVDVVGTTFNIKDNSDFFNYTNDIKITKVGTGDEIQTITFDFRNNGSYVILRETDRFAVELNDDFSSVNDMKVQINGFTYLNSSL